MRFVPVELLPAQNPCMCFLKISFSSGNRFAEARRPGWPASALPATHTCTWPSSCFHLWSGSRGCSETGRRRWGGLGRGDWAGSLWDSGLTPAGRVPGVVLSTNMQQPQWEFTPGWGWGSPSEGASQQLRRFWPEAADGSCGASMSRARVLALLHLCLVHAAPVSTRALWEGPGLPPCSRQVPVNVRCARGSRRSLSRSREQYKAPCLPRCFMLS